jgi:cytochrome P450
MTTSRPTEVDAYGAPQHDFDSLPMSLDRKVGWDALRDAGPVVFMNGWYHLTHREDVLNALRTPEIYSSRKAFDILGSPLPLVPISFDPPEHTRFRKILQPFFSPHTLNEMLPALQEQAVEMVDAIAAKGGCDVVTEIAIPYPSQVFLTLYGLPLRDRDRLIHWKDTVIALADLPNLDGADLAPALELFSYLTNAINERRESPEADVLSQLLTGTEPLDDAEAIGLSYLFVLAGLDTVTAAIGFAPRNPQPETKGRTARGSRTRQRVRRRNRPTGTAGAHGPSSDHRGSYRRRHHAASGLASAAVPGSHQPRRQ